MYCATAAHWNAHWKKSDDEFIGGAQCASADGSGQDRPNVSITGTFASLSA